MGNKPMIGILHQFSHGELSCQKFEAQECLSIGKWPITLDLAVHNLAWACLSHRLSVWVCGCCSHHQCLAWSEWLWTYPGIPSVWVLFKLSAARTGHGQGLSLMQGIVNATVTSPRVSLGNGVGTMLPPFALGAVVWSVAHVFLSLVGWVG